MITFDQRGCLEIRPPQSTESERLSLRHNLKIYNLAGTFERRSWQMLSQNCAWQLSKAMRASRHQSTQLVPSNFLVLNSSKSSNLVRHNLASRFGSQTQNLLLEACRVGCSENFKKHF